MKYNAVVTFTKDSWNTNGEFVNDAKNESIFCTKCPRDGSFIWHPPYQLNNNERRKKMKNVKRALTLVLVVLMMAALLTACTGNTTAPSPSPSTAASPSAAAPAEETASMPTTEMSEVGTSKLGNGKDISKEEINIAYIPISTAGQVNQVIDLLFKDVTLIYPNVKITPFDPQYDPNRQNSMIVEAVTGGYDAIIALIMDPAASADAVTQAEQAGIPVITIDCGTTAVHTFHLQGTDYGTGLLAAEVVAKELNNEGNYIVLDVPAEQKAVGRMGTAFIDYMTANTKCVMLEDTSIAAWSQENARIAMADHLTKYGPGEIQAVYCASDDLAGGALQAIEAAGRDKEGIILYGNCGYLPVLQAIKEGRMFGTNFTDTYARYYTAFHMALYFIQTGTTSVTAGYTATPAMYDTLIPVNKDNVDYFIEVSRFTHLMG
jgi:simple sugar transport system substrate-binding protein/ribose transport system substrate-binding protein